jgi:hypothetical protein
MLYVARVKMIRPKTVEVFVGNDLKVIDAWIMNIKPGRLDEAEVRISAPTKGADITICSGPIRTYFSKSNLIHRVNHS